MQQQTLDAQYNDWLRQMQWPYQQNQFLGTAISNAAGGSGSTTSTQTQPGQSIWGNLLGGALVGARSLWNGWNG